jgi:hypothetical protein
MNNTPAGLLSISVTKCRDEVGRIVLLAKVHGCGYLYAPGRVNGGCILSARSLAGRRVLVTIEVNGEPIAFIATVKPRSRYAIAVNIPKRLRGTFRKGDLVTIRLKPIKGDGR